MNQELDSLESLLVTQTMMTEIRHYCLENKTEEVCGLIGGFGEYARSFYPTQNISEDRSHGYLVDPGDQIKAMKEMQSRREEFLGIFHSHPNSPAEPSPTDIALAAYPGVAYLIASLANDDVKFASYLFTGEQFKKLPLVYIEGAR